MEPSSGGLNLAEVGRRLADIRGAVSQKDFAVTLGIHSNTLGRYERGESPIDADTLFRLHQLGHSSDAVLYGITPLPSLTASSHDLPATVMVPRYNLKLGAGIGLATWEIEKVGELGFHRDWLRKKGLLRHEMLGLAEVAGPSMEPDLFDRDLVLFDRGDTNIRGGKCYALRIRDETVVKFLSRMPDGTIQVSSKNSLAFPTFWLPADPADDHYEIVGRIRASSRDWD